MESLQCPITQDWFEDPVTVECCGQSFSRQPLLLALTRSEMCPMCKSPIDSKLIAIKKANVSLAELAEMERKKEEKNQNELFPKKPDWKAIISTLELDADHNVGYLELVSSQKHSTLVCVVVDVSGSMGGSPLQDVKSCLHRIVETNYQTPAFHLEIVEYSHSFSVYSVDLKKPMKEHVDWIQKRHTIGGTSFAAAFKGIVQVASQFAKHADYTSLQVVFLTDGEDSEVSGVARLNLVKELQTNLKQVWTEKPLVIHTVGFAAQHDFKFLNDLRMVGTAEGIYRYVNPQRGNDDGENSLSSKIGAIVKEISREPIVALEILSIPHRILNETHLNQTKLWLRLDEKKMDQSIEIMFHKEKLTLSAEYKEASRQHKEEWFHFLIEKIGSDVVEFVKYKSEQKDKDKEDEKNYCLQLFKELLIRRAQAITDKVHPTSSNGIRLQELIKALENEQLDAKQLVDLRFESKDDRKKKIALQQQTLQQLQLQQQEQQQAFAQSNSKKHLGNQGMVESEWKTVDLRPSPTLSLTISDRPSALLCEEMEKTKSFTFDTMRQAAYLGRMKVLETMIKILIDEKKAIPDDILHLTLAKGFWKSFGILFRSGARLDSGIDPDDLLRTLLSKRYFESAQKLFQHKLVHISADMIAYAPNVECFKWLSSHNLREVTWEEALKQGLVDILETKLEEIPLLSWRPYLESFFFHEEKKDLTKAAANKEMLTLLIEHKKLNCNEWIEEEDAKTTWPLFLAAQKGKAWLCDLILRMEGTHFLNKRNHLGNTPLWIAACNGHLEICHKFIESGADVNSCNTKGDSVLSIAVQKGHDVVVDLLLAHQAQIDLEQKNGDNVVFMACRTGQHKVLHVLLEKIFASSGDGNGEAKTSEFLRHVAAIDGFSPLMGAAELNHVECLKVILKLDPNASNQRTSEDNKVIGSALAIHIAALYGKLDAVRYFASFNPSLLLATTLDGDTCLHMAVKNNHLGLTRYILTLKEGKQSAMVANRMGKFPKEMASLGSACEKVFLDNLGTLLSQMMSYCSKKVWDKACKILATYAESFGSFGIEDIVKSDLGAGWRNVKRAVLLRNLTGLADLFGFKQDPESLFWTQYFRLNGSMYQGKSDSKNSKSAWLERIEAAKRVNWQSKHYLDLNPLDFYANESSLVWQGISPSEETPQNATSILSVSFKEEDQKDKTQPFLVGYTTTLPSLLGPNNSYMVLWNAKCQAIEAVACGEEKDPLKVVAWTLIQNDVIRFSIKRISTLQSEKNPLAKVLLNSWSDLAPYEKEEAYYCLSSSAELKLEKGDVIGWNNFLLASPDTSIASHLIQNGKSDGVIFLIQSEAKKGKQQTWGRANNNNQAHVIFPPHAQFRVVNFYKSKLTALYQANTRNSTYNLSSFQPPCMVLLKDV